MQNCYTLVILNIPSLLILIAKLEWERVARIVHRNMGGGEISVAYAGCPLVGEESQIKLPNIHFPGKS